MKRMKFKCTLLSDVIINQKAATEGSNTTLDFIPGNVFLGIVASHYQDFGDKALEVFHSGKVRFGDAHPVSQVPGAVRTLHVPASMYYPKLKSVTGGCYIHHFYKREEDKENNGRPQQLKQCRQGFYAFKDGRGYPVSLEKSFAIKSAYDRSRRCSLDSMMYGYESLDAGACFFFDVEVDDESLVPKIKGYLLGKHRAGRSRSAQYGLVDICETDYNDVPSSQESFSLDDDCNYVTVYADGRLIFLDDNFESTFQPKASDLGIEGGEIIWKYCQIRTFNYAPWNNKRSTRDGERCGIEKGSVFVVRVSVPQNYESRYVGVYQNEGFGKVIYNPPFLCAKKEANGAAQYRLQGVEADGSAQSADKESLSGTLLLDYIAQRQKEDEAEKFIYESVNAFVEEYGGKPDSNKKGIFSDETFASQWGTIRSIAMQKRTYNDLINELFEKKKRMTRTKENKEEMEPDAYLTHGVAAERWKKFGRKDKLRKFIEEIHSPENLQRFGDITAKALVNLSSEMSKHAKN